MDIIPYQIVRAIFLLVAIISIIISAYIIYHAHKKHTKLKTKKVIAIEAVILIVTITIGLFAGVAYSGFISVPLFVKTVGPGLGPHLPLETSWKFFKNMDKFERIQNIAANPTQTGIPIERENNEHINITITAKEVISEIAPGITYNYWTFDRQVPGPFIRAKENDTITINLHNHETSLHEHSIDLHAVNGPGGGASVLSAKPGKTATFTFKATHAGLFVYHCASMPSPAAHMAHGQYGLILVEPSGGLSKVDKEFYIMQGEIYTQGNTGFRGLQAFDAKKMLEENPTYIVFNGKVNGPSDKLKANAGDKIRIYAGNGGVGLISSFHIIGEIFDTVYPEASIDETKLKNVQTTIIPAGGATIVEFTIDEPGKYTIVDHSLARTEKGAYAIITAEGEFNHELYSPEPQNKPNSMH